MINVIYKHKHHIIPKHLGGTDDPSNLVYLTISGHAAVHLYLYEEYDRWQDKLAWKALSGQIGKEEILKQIIKNRTYKTPSMLGKKHSEETKIKMSNIAKQRDLTYLRHPDIIKKAVITRSGYVHSNETKDKIKKKALGRIFSKETKDKIGNAHKNIFHTEKWNKNVSLSKLGNKNMLGKKHSEETKIKMSKSAKGKVKSPEHKKNISKSKKGIKLTDAHKQKISESVSKAKLGLKYIKKQCPYCKKAIGINNFERYHNLNCKEK